MTCIPDGFRDRWFLLDAGVLARNQVRTELVQELMKLVPMVNEMDDTQIDVLVMALGAGLP